MRIQRKDSAEYDSLLKKLTVKLGGGMGCAGETSTSGGKKTKRKDEARMASGEGGRIRIRGQRSGRGGG